MKKVVWSGLATAVAVLAMSTPAQAQLNATDTVNVSATVSGRAKLDVNIPAITFADEDPDTTPVINASRHHRGELQTTSTVSAPKQ